MWERSGWALPDEEIPQIIRRGGGGGTTVRAYVAEVRMYNVAGGWPATRRWGWCRAWRLLQYILPHRA